MKHLYLTSRLFPVACISAALEGGVIERVPGDEHILVVYDSTPIPEVIDSFYESEHFELAASSFDRVVNLSEIVWPLRASQFNPRETELVIWQRLLRRYWDLGDEDVCLVVESIQVNPAPALAKVFATSRVSVHSDGLMTYGPTRNDVAHSVAQRLDRLYYLDLAAGIEPLVLSEHHIELVEIPASGLAEQIERLRPTLEPEIRALRQEGRRSALVLGQYFVDLGLLTSEENRNLDQQMIARAAELGCDICYFKPHPAVSQVALDDLKTIGGEIGIEVEVVVTQALAEVVALELQPDLVISCFSTGMFTVHKLFEIPMISVHSDMMLDRLKPYENSNRIPAVLADYLAGEERPAVPLDGLIGAVSYAMQAERLEKSRNDVTEFLEQYAYLAGKYFKRRRLTALGLPGGAQQTVISRAASNGKRLLRRGRRSAIEASKRFAQFTDDVLGSESRKG